MLLMVEFCERRSTLGLINMEYIFAKKSEKKIIKILYIQYVKKGLNFNVNKNRNLLITGRGVSEKVSAVCFCLGSGLFGSCNSD